MNQKTKPEAKQKPPVAYAYYELVGTDKRANAFVRPSAHKDGWYEFENTFNEHDHGTKSKILKRYVTFDRNMIQQGYQRKNNFVGDQAFAL